MKKAVVLKFHKFESPMPKGALCQVRLKLAFSSGELKCVPSTKKYMYILLDIGCIFFIKRKIITFYVAHMCQLFCKNTKLHDTAEIERDHLKDPA